MSNLEALIQAAQYLEENDRELVLQWDLLLGVLVWLMLLVIELIIKVSINTYILYVSQQWPKCEFCCQLVVWLFIEVVAIVDDGRNNLKIPQNPAPLFACMLALGKTGEGAYLQDCDISTWSPWPPRNATHVCTFLDLSTTNPWPFAWH